MGKYFSKLIDKLLGNVEIRLLMLGLDSSGKTSILYKLKLGQVIQSVPTIGKNLNIF